MNELKRSLIGHTTLSLGSPWLFFGVTYALTWIWWLAAIALGVSFASAQGAALLLLGLLGPGIAGIGFVYLVYDAPGRADFWNRVRKPGRIGLQWLLIILLVPIVVTLAAAIADSVLRGPGVTLGTGVQDMRRNPVSVLPTIFFATLPPLLEELGWRGYALDRLQLNWSAFSSGVLLGIVWALWHLPLFFIQGSFQREEVGFATDGFWLFMIGIVALSVIITWTYNNTSRSILGVIILHGWVNFVSETIEVADEFYYSIWVLSALLVVGIWGAKTLRKGTNVPHPPVNSD